MHFTERGCSIGTSSKIRKPTFTASNMDYLAPDTVKNFWIYSFQSLEIFNQHPVVLGEARQINGKLTVHAVYHAHEQIYFTGWKEWRVSKPGKKASKETSKLDRTWLQVSSHPLCNSWKLFVKSFVDKLYRLPANQLNKNENPKEFLSSFDSKQKAGLSRKKNSRGDRVYYKSCQKFK